MKTPSRLGVWELGERNFLEFNPPLHNFKLTVLIRQLPPLSVWRVPRWKVTPYPPDVVGNPVPSDLDVQRSGLPAVRFPALQKPIRTKRRGFLVWLM